MPVLSEYKFEELDLTRSQAERLQQTGFVTVSPAPGTRWRVTASSYVGSLVVDGVELLIRPKINPENLFLLLEPGLPPRAWRQEAFDYATSPDLLPSMIAFFARTVETTLGRGVLRSYESRRDPLIALRGRIDVAGQFRRAGVLSPVACTYDDFSEDISENRVLRAAIRLALRVPRVNPADRQRLMRQLVALEAVADTDVRAEAVDAIPVTRLNQHYAPALRLARLLLANLTLTDAHGAVSAASFMVDMNDLFQRFVTERLRRRLGGILEVVDEPTVHLDLRRQVAMRPDLEFRRAGAGVCYVGDVKYKPSGGGYSSDYYQLLAYTTALDLPEGMLVYCRRQGDPVLRTTTVRHSGKRLLLYAVDLTGSPEQVEQEIDELAETVLRSARQPAEVAQVPRLTG